MRTHLRTAKLTGFLILLAVALTWLVSGRATATTTFQSPNPFDSALPTPTVQLTASPTSTMTAVPAPTLSPTPESTSEPSPSPTPPGYLPPPTLTSPGTVVPAVSPSQSLSELPLRPAATATSLPDERQPGANAAATIAGLIDQGVLALGYLWLCCGVLALIGIAGALVWFFRRSRRG